MENSERRSKRPRVTATGGPSGSTSDDHRLGATYKVPGYVVWDHFFKVPLDHSGRSSDQKITIFAREVVAPNKMHQQFPYLLYLQGGPGFAATLPIDAGAWLRTATNYFRVILLDQRGTGRSTPISCRNLQKRGPPKQQTEYLKLFRADSIVKDAEIIRKILVPRHCQGGKWSVLGQSYGGFCAVHYLSAAPEGLAEVMIAAGIPPLIAEKNPTNEAYKALFKRVITQNERYYERFPEDIQIVWRIVEYLHSQEEGGVRLPGGSILTPRSFQLLGCSGLGFAGGFERLHFLLETAFDEGELSYRFMKGFENWMSWETNPLYVLLHEPIYSQGGATHWSAHRTRLEQFEGQFDAMRAIKEGRPVYFTGEMVFPWMFEDFDELVPLRETAEMIANVEDWPLLYDIDNLKSNTVPVSTIMCCEDMCVDFNLALRSVENIQGMKQWMTNEYMHSAIRDDGGRVFDKLMAMARDSLLLN